MPVLKLEHFKRAIEDVASHGDNDVLPFDVDTRFLAEKADDLAQLAFDFGLVLENKRPQDCKAKVQELSIFSERLLAPVGPAGFRITTKIHPFWNIYFNALGVAIAERHEPSRNSRAHSYRFTATGPSLFDRNASWRTFRRATIDDCEIQGDSGIVVQTDISSFYEHIYHHRLENFINDILPETPNHSIQIDRLLNKFSSGRSFGVPVGGQCSRVLAEVLLGSVDRTLNTAGICWRRYVDDFVLVADSQHNAYAALSKLSHALGDLGLSLNRTKTTFLSALHYKDYVNAQLSATDEESRRLKEIDLHFDPYSDSAVEDYDELQETVAKLDIARLVAIELDKGQPDSFIVSQVSRALGLMEPNNALGVCATLLQKENLHSFRASWSSIMRGIALIRGKDEFQSIHSTLDYWLDMVPMHSSHLALIDTNSLHYLRTIRFKPTEERAIFVLALYERSRADTVRRACIDCWRTWKDRERFIALRNMWQSLSEGEQRMMWLAAPDFGDDGKFFQKQVRRTLPKLWGLGFEDNSSPTFVETYLDWAANA